MPIFWFDILLNESLISLINIDINYKYEILKNPLMADFSLESINSETKMEKQNIFINFRNLITTLINNIFIDSQINASTDNWKLKINIATAWNIFHINANFITRVCFSHTVNYIFFVLMSLANYTNRAISPLWENSPGRKRREKRGRERNTDSALLCQSAVRLIRRWAFFREQTVRYNDAAVPLNS